MLSPSKNDIKSEKLNKIVESSNLTAAYNATLCQDEILKCVTHHKPRVDDDIVLNDEAKQVKVGVVVMRRETSDEKVNVAKF